MSKVGYERVSTDKQSLDGQHDRLEAYGCDRIFSDQAQSGRKASRPEFDKMLDFLRPGDQLVVIRLDRLGRSVRNLVELVSHLSEREIDIVVLDQGIDTSTPAGRFFMHLMMALAEMEADLIAERSRDGRAAARARGRLGGRKRKLSDVQEAHVVELYRAKKLTVKEIAEKYAISRDTVYEILHRASAVRTGQVA